MEHADVVVVGAGFAGLIAARSLRDAGRTTLVLEARDRVGGRTHTSEHAGAVVDLGGQWLGPGQDRAYSLAAQLDAPTFPQTTAGDDVVVLDGVAHRVADPALALPDTSIGAYIEAVGELEALADEVPLDAPWAAPHADTTDATTLAAWLAAQVTDDTARSMIRVGVQAVFAAEPEQLSLLHVLFYLRAGGGWASLTDSEGGAQQDLLVHGLGDVAVRLAATLGDAVRLSRPVATITQTAGAVDVIGPDGERASASHVIVAVPPALAGRITYDPALPGRRDQLTQRMPAGSVVKFHIVYDEPWWRDAGLSGQVLSPEDRVGVTFDCTRPGGPGVITGFFEGDHALWAAEVDRDARRAAVLDVLTAHLGPAAADPRGYVDRDWSAERWTRGCYGAHLPPGAWTRYGPALREPVGRIHWAGTETATRWMGYVDGAIESGERAAAEVLGARG